MAVKYFFVKEFFMAYRIVTDSGCDFPLEMYAELDVTVIPLLLNFRGQEHTDLSEAFIKELYAGLRAGEAASTAAVNPEGWKSVIAPILASGQDALVLPFSSGLSTTYQSAVIAAMELSEEYPDRQVKVVDIRCASMGQGLMVYYACQMRDAGLSLDALVAWIEQKIPTLCHWLTVDDLMYLKRGGRINAATAIAGTMLQIKPILHVDDEGKLVTVAKARGRKAAIDFLAKKMADTGLPGENDTVFISHGDCLEEAQTLAKLLKETCGVQNVIISYIGAVIGSHAGPGTIAMFYLGSKR